MSTMMTSHTCFIPKSQKDKMNEFLSKIIHFNKNPSKNFVNCKIIRKFASYI